MARKFVVHKLNKSKIWIIKKSWRYLSSKFIIREKQSMQCGAIGKKRWDFTGKTVICKNNMSQGGAHAQLPRNGTGKLVIFKEYFCDTICIERKEIEKFCMNASNFSIITQLYVFNEQYPLFSIYISTIEHSLTECSKNYDKLINEI